MGEREQVTGARAEKRAFLMTAVNLSLRPLRLPERRARARWELVNPWMQAGP
jgi:hypothetical protein